MKRPVTLVRQAPDKKIPHSDFKNFEDYAKWIGQISKEEPMVSLFDFNDPIKHAKAPIEQDKPLRQPFGPFFPLSYIIWIEEDFHEAGDRHAASRIFRLCVQYDYPFPIWVIHAINDQLAESKPGSIKAKRSRGAHANNLKAKLQTLVEHCEIIAAVQAAHAHRPKDDKAREKVGKGKMRMSKADYELADTFLRDWFGYGKLSIDTIKQKYAQRNKLKSVPGLEWFNPQFYIEMCASAEADALADMLDRPRY